MTVGNQQSAYQLPESPQLSGSFALAHLHHRHTSPAPIGVFVLHGGYLLVAAQVIPDQRTQNAITLAVYDAEFVVAQHDSIVHKLIQYTECYFAALTPDIEVEAEIQLSLV